MGGEEIRTYRIPVLRSQRRKLKSTVLKTRLLSAMVSRILTIPNPTNVFSRNAFQGCEENLTIWIWHPFRLIALGNQQDFWPVANAINDFVQTCFVEDVIFANFLGLLDIFYQWEVLRIQAVDIGLASEIEMQT
ncbi:hypothetical protein TMatcc_003597 [Talaromyces marneffei ATCC 18224]